MTAMARNIFLMCFSAFVLNTAILAHADAGYFADNLQKIKEYIASDTLHYYIKDYQGNVRIVVRQDGAVVESNEYYPYGGLFAATASVQPYKYSSKELDRTHGLDLYDSEARWYDSLLGRTSTMDPKAEKYYSISPYLWCAGNPMKYVDPSGQMLIITDLAAQKALRNTLSQEDREYIRFNENGLFDIGRYLSHYSDSYNYRCIGEIALSTDIMTIEMNNEYNYVDNSGKVKNRKMDYHIDLDIIDYDISSAYSNTTGESGTLGIALLPGIGTSGVNSLDKNIHVVLNDKLSEEGAVSNISHEVFGHGLIYIRTHNRSASRHLTNPYGGLKDYNQLLIDLIYKSLKESINNFRGL